MIHVLIERQISPDLEANYEEISRNVLYKAFQAEGFVSGETFYDVEKPNIRFVISRWRTLKDWKTWAASHERKEGTNHLNPILERPETVRILAQ